MARVLVPLAGLLALSSSVSLPSSPERISDSFNEVARVASPSVVSVSAVRTVTPQEAAAEDLPFGFGMPLPPPQGMPEPGIGMGSGVVIRADGVILTNHHVVESATRVTVGLDEKTRVKARVIGSDRNSDIAVLQIEPKEREGRTFVPIDFGDSDGVKMGDWALAIGSPFGLYRTVTSGIVSAKGRGHLGVIDIEDFIQTDAAINPGNSGGPLLDMDGRMIGLNAAIFSQGGGFVGIGFSIPSNLARKISEEILAHGRVIRGWLGIAAQDLDSRLARYFKLREPRGALVSDVKPGGPGDEGELRAGDVIVRYDSRPIEGASDLKTHVGRTRIGAKVPVEVVRAGKIRTLALRVREQPGEMPPAAQQQAGVVGDEDKEGTPSVGVALQDIPRELMGILGAKPGEGAFVAGVRPGSPAYDAGLAPGDVILKANGRAIHGADDAVKFFKELQPDKKGDLAVLYVQRGPEERVFVPLELHAG
jgi:serine protease Do